MAYTKLNLSLDNYSEYLFQFFFNHLSKDKVNRVVISGGNTPKIFFSYLNNNIDKLDNYKIDFFWLDERVVDICNSKSNYGSFIRLVEIIDNSNINTFPMYLSLNTIEENIERYYKIINNIISNNKNFDFGILGMGMDGHVASIFDLDSSKKEDLLLRTKDNSGLDRISMNISLIDKIKVKVLLCDNKKYEILNNKELNLPVQQVVFDKVIVLNG